MSTTTLVRAVCALLAAAGALFASLVFAPTAHASCAGNPPASPYSFTGVVLGTELYGRLAYVATDDGRSVVVRGTISDVDDAFTTVDRTYVTGHRYVFHPLNSTSPYEDNICTATLDLGPAPTTEPSTAARTTAAETELADGRDDSVAPRTALVVGAVLGLALVGAGLVLVRRGRREAPAPGTDAAGST